MENQDLHIHTIFSSGDGALVPQQTPQLIAEIKHAKVIGISDHFEYIRTYRFEEYRDVLRSLGLKVGTEVDGSRLVSEAVSLDFDYYIYHCRNEKSEYSAIQEFLNTGKPLIIAHPYAMGTNLDKIPQSCYVEINNRYIWRYDWRNYFSEHLKKFRYILSSDAHQPHWLSQHVARYVAEELGIKETIIF